MEINSQTTTDSTAQSGQVSSAASVAAVEATSLGQTEFLKLMIAQVQNQDPFAPMENGDFIGQMAQFSSVDGIKKMNSSLESMADSFNHGQSLQAASLVGRQVVAPTSAAILTAGNPVFGEVDLTDNVSSLLVEVRDQNGGVVQSIDLGPQASGRINFSWDGADESGNQQLDGMYYVGASAPVGGVEKEFATLMGVTVQSVSLNGALKTPQLLLSDGTNIGLDKVEQIH
jgi:flagellar basal-body rod modification protein FlgD